jgi:dTDP-4-amino-4,6-dideoxygalactose transaminase
MEGYNGRLDAIQAGLLHVKLKHLAGWNQSRQERARKYNELLSAANIDIRTPYEPAWSKAIYHLYVVQVENREAVQAALAKENIGTGIHYPIPLHLQKAYANQGYRPGDFPVTEKAVKRILSLPMFPNLTEADQARVVQAIARSVRDTTQQAAVFSD